MRSIDFRGPFGYKSHPCRTMLPPSSNESPRYRSERPARARREARWDASTTALLLRTCRVELFAPGEDRAACAWQEPRLMPPTWTLLVSGPDCARRDPWRIASTKAHPCGRTTLLALGECRSDSTYTGFATAGACMCPARAAADCIHVGPPCLRPARAAPDSARMGFTRVGACMRPARAAAD